MSDKKRKSSSDIIHSATTCRVNCEETKSSDCHDVLFFDDNGRRIEHDGYMPSIKGLDENGEDCVVFEMCRVCKRVKGYEDFDNEEMIKRLMTRGKLKIDGRVVRGEEDEDEDEDEDGDDETEDGEIKDDEVKE
jgi:hypothetical protein